MERFKAVIWDTGGVLTPDGYSDIEQRIASYLNIGINNLRAEVGKHKDEATIGKITLGELYKRVLSDLHLSIPPEQIVKLHIDLYKDFTANIDPNIAQLIKDLAVNNYQNSYLTNTEQEIYQYNIGGGLWKYYPDGGIASVNAGTKKPEPEIYLAALRRLKLEDTPELAVFIDDKEEYVDGAKRVGIQGLWYPKFGQAETLRKKLMELGINLK